VLPPNRSEAIAARPLAASATLRTPGTLTIGYAGSLAYGYGAGLCELLPALETSHARLCLYTDQRLPQESPFVEYRGRGKTPEETWSRVQGECDAVVLAYAWDEAYRSLYETHFPSKLPEYLALGLPVLIAGPPDAAGVRWGLENGGAGLVLNERSLPAAQQALRDLRETSSRRQELAAGALAAGSAQFDPVRIRETFVGVLQSLTVRPENPPGTAHG
jgi:glycosyltransferase involved in cell wall biosynthesis